MNQSLFDPRYLNIEYFFNQILEFFSIIGNVLGGDFSAVTSRIKIVLLFLSLLFIAGIIYTAFRILEIRRSEHEKYHTVDIAIEPADGGFRRERWQTIIKKMESENISDWKLAIIEADTLLDEMVKKMGYPGENLGERLRHVEVSDFTSLQEAWEAHKVRNRIAHDSSDQFILTAREARRVIGLFEKVFREFKYI
ncbi:MAG: hypothetical protein HYT28_00515 [Parcubacteria group bacterium]|nr:hypothetical protein [Parcubacteria group bacterium]